MKRLINYIKNLFGADVRLRKWCIKQLNIRVDAPSAFSIKQAQALYDFIRGQL